MHARRFRVSRIVRVGALALLLIFSAHSEGRTREDCQRDYQPQGGQRGKDVVWVPTSDVMVLRMLELAKVTEKDVVYDLGAGDGKIAITAAARYGAAAVGVEYNPLLVRLAKCLVEAAGVSDRVTIHEDDLFAVDFSEATVVTLYLMPSLNLRLRPRLLDLKPGTRVVSHSFPMGDWKPDAQSANLYGRAYLWIVPAKVAGTWQFVEQRGFGKFIAHLEQTFQELRGTAGAQKAALDKARLSGSDIEFSFSEGGKRIRVTGHVTGDRIDARVTRDRETFTYIGTRLQSAPKLPAASTAIREQRSLTDTHEKRQR